MISVIIFVIVSSTALLNASRSFEREVSLKRELLSAAASGHAAAVAIPVASGSRQEALLALRGIRDLPDVKQVDIRLSDGSILAQIGTGAVLLRPDRSDSKLSTADLWNARQLRIELPILNNGEEIGQLRMLADLSDLRVSVYSQLRITALTALLAICIGVVLAYRMISRMTNPLHRLSVHMASFADDRAGDYEAIAVGQDETGVLAKTFEEMVSSIRLRDKKLARHMETLEDTIQERTHDLQIAKNAAEDANAAKSDFLATMSHEIRTPMNGMLVMAEMLSSADLSQRHRRYAEIISRSGNSLLTIINDILDMSKIEAGKLELEERPISIDTLVSDIAMLFWERAREKGIELTTYVSPQVPREIIADPTRMNQIVTNLVNNALKFTETGSVQIRVSAKPAQMPGISTLLIEVEDTGIGIPESKVETIFDAFSQVDKSTTRRFGGTGLGLAVCRRLVDTMGGTISASSQVGHGSIFRLELNVPVAIPAPSLEPSRLKVCVSGVPESTAHYLKTFLEEAGCMVTANQADLQITTSHSLARQSLSNKVPNIILSDIGDARANDMLQSRNAVDLLPNPYTRNDLIDLLVRAKSQDYRGVNALAVGNTQKLYSDFEGMHVLAADDNAVNREVLREALSALNVEVDFAENGRQATEMIKSRTYDAILMDGSMPEMDGFEATRAICEYEAYMNKKPTPIIALTAQVVGVTQEAWKAAGAEYYVTKPFTLQRLNDVLSSLGREDTGQESLNETLSESSDIPLINQETIAGLVALSKSSGRDLQARVWDLFRVKAQESLAALTELVSAKGSRTEISKQSHALKSMALSAGAERLAATCEDIETSSNENETWDEIERLLQGASDNLTATLAVSLTPIVDNA